MIALTLDMGTDMIMVWHRHTTCLSNPKVPSWHATSALQCQVCVKYPRRARWSRALSSGSCTIKSKNIDGCILLDKTRSDDHCLTAICECFLVPVTSHTMQGGAPKSTSPLSGSRLCPKRAAPKITSTMMSDYSGLHLLSGWLIRQKVFSTYHAASFDPSSSKET